MQHDERFGKKPASKSKVGAVYVTTDVTGALAPRGDETIDLSFFSLDALPHALGRLSRLVLERYRCRAGSGVIS